MPHPPSHLPEKAVSRMESQRLGALGERWVRERLERQGVDILAANWRCQWGEIDLIAANASVIAFIEVKTRRSDGFGAPKEAVNYAKRQRLVHSAQQWLMEHPDEQRQPRFDVAEVLAPQGSATRSPIIHYIPNAFPDESE